MKRILALCCALVLALGMLGCATAEEAAAPKYVFMFIGNGMGSPQVSATQYFLGTLQNPDATLPTPAELSFTTFQNVGIMTTYDASSFCPDSASTATSMASGEKTLSGVINYNIDKTEPFKIITEYAKEAGKKVGVISTVSLNHATPAAYYAKMPSRNDYYDIAVQGITGDTLDFIGGGNWNQPDGDGTQANLYDLARENGFNVVNTNEGIRAINADSGRTLAVVPDPNDDYAMQYEIDRLRLEAQGTDSLALSEIVKAAIANLDNENGFFLMTEGGKIDWSCHANDAMTSIYDTIALSDAVQVAIDFAAEHPDETLDHRHRRPRDRRPDHRLRRHRLRYPLRLPAKPEDELRGLRQGDCQAPGGKGRLRQGPGGHRGQLRPDHHRRPAPDPHGGGADPHRERLRPFHD